MDLRLKEYLDELYLRYKFKFSSKDPVWILHEFQDEKDIEIIGLITSCYAYGQVDRINLFIRTFLQRIENKVYEFTLNFDKQKDKKYLKGLNYRFNTDEDLIYLIINIGNTLQKHKNLKNAFLKNYSVNEKNVINSLKLFVDELTIHKPKKSLYFNYLLPNPANGSTCKRLNLFLRWMVRQDEIDLGTWSREVDKAKLIMPVDTHIFRITKQLELIKRKSYDIKFAIELTEKLKQSDPLDPVKYDFALCHVGIDKIKNLPVLKTWQV